MLGTTASHGLPPQAFTTAQDAACIVERVVKPRAFTTAQDAACIVERVVKPRGFFWECQVGPTLVGAIVKRNGKVLCTIEGTYSGKTGCWTYTMCGQAFEECTR